MKLEDEKPGWKVVLVTAIVVATILVVAVAAAYWLGDLLRTLTYGQ